MTFGIDGVGEGVAVGDGVAVGLEVGDGDGEAVGVSTGGVGDETAVVGVAALGWLLLQPFEMASEPESVSAMALTRANRVRRDRCQVTRLRPGVPAGDGRISPFFRDWRPP